MFITAYGFQQNLFPTVRSLKKPSKENALLSVFNALLLAMIIYIILSVLSLYTFGSQVRPDIMDNVGDGKHVWESVTLRVAFFIVIICHIPFVFFSSKEALLIIIDELDRKSISH